MYTRNEQGINIVSYVPEYGSIAFADHIIFENFGYTIDRLKNHNRKREVAAIRKLWFYLLLEHTDNITQIEAGDYANRDRTALIHGRNDVKGMIESEEYLSLEIEKELVRVAKEVESIKRKLL